MTATVLVAALAALIAWRVLSERVTAEQRAGALANLTRP